MPYAPQVGVNQTGGVTEASLTTLNAKVATETTLALIKTATQLMALWDATGRAKVSQQKSTTSTCASVAFSAATNITFLAANANRLGAAIFNNSNVNITLRLGPNAAAGYTVVIPVMGYYEVPFGYTGIIDGAFWGGASSGSASVTELLP